MLGEIRNHKNYENLFQKMKNQLALFWMMVISNDNKKVITHGEIVKTKL